MAPIMRGIAHAWDLVGSAVRLSLSPQAEEGDLRDNSEWIVHTDSRGEWKLGSKASFWANERWRWERVVARA